MDDVTQLTRQLVQIDSSDPGAYETKIAVFINAWLKQHAPGAKVETDEVLPKRYNVHARLKGQTAHPALVYICHQDTVVLGDDWQQTRPLSGEIKGSRLYGRGACDMKGGLASALLAFAAIAQSVAAGQPLQHDFVFIASVDEEDYMRGSEKAIQSGWVKPEDWVLDGEPTNGLIRMAHKGRTWIQLVAHGMTAHASTPEQGVDANAALAQLMTAIRQQIQAFPTHPKLGPTTITFGKMLGGYRPYVVPDQAKVWVDLRLVPPLTTQKVLQLFKQEITHTKNEFPGLKVDMIVDGDRPPIEENLASPLLANLKTVVKEVTQRPAKMGVFTGYSDTAVIAGQLKNVNCLSYGPGDLQRAHKPDEYVEIADLTRCQRVMQQLAQQVLLNHHC